MQCSVHSTALRFVLASTQDLHEKISELCCRVRELEDALRESNSHLSDQPHPLLAEELLKIKAPLERDASESNQQDIKKEDLSPDVVDSFGSLSISQTGKTKFYGHTANSWVRFPNSCPETNHLIYPYLSSVRSISSK